MGRSHVENRKNFKKSTIKSIFLASFLLVVFIAGTGISQMLGTSYAAVQPMASLPDTLTSKQEKEGGQTAAVPSSWVEGIPAASLSGRRNTYQFPKRFYGISNGVEYELYCLERWLGQPVDVTYTKTDSASALSELNIDYKKMAYLLSQLYPNNDNFLSQLNGNSDAKYIKKFVSQLAIWYFQDRNANYQDNQDICGRPETEENACSDDADPDNRTEFYWKNSLLAAEKEALKKSPYWQEVNQIVTDALNYSEDTNYGITVDKSTINYTLVEDDKYLESTLIEVVSKGSNFKGYTLQIDQSDVTFYNEQGAEIKKGTTVQPGQKFRFRVPVSTVRENKKLNLNIHINGTFESKDAYMYRPGSKNSQRALIGTMQLTPIPASLELQIDDPMGAAKINKVDDTTGKAVPGATLVLTDSNGKEVARWVSTNDPYTLDPIKAGTYMLKEVKAPKGYILNTKTVQFNVEAGKTIEVKMENTKLGGASIRKTDMVTGEEVEGATLIVQNEAGEEIERWVSGKEAHSIEALEDGTYTLIEITAPTGYVKNESHVTFKVEAGKTTPVEMENEPYGKAQVLKIDTLTKKPLKGATLAIFDGAGRQVETWESEEDAHSVSLVAGSYTLKETKAPKGYKLNSTVVPIQIQAGKTTEVQMENIELGKASIRKTDMVTGEEVEGATLIVQNEAGDEIARWVSGKEAHSIEALEDGTYTLIEITAPTGYVKNESHVTFQVEAGKTTPVQMENEPYGKAQILKIDTLTQKPLKGATLAILDGAGRQVETWESEEDAHSVSLVAGSYTLKEIKAPKGYKLNNVAVPIQIQAGKTTEVQMENIELGKASIRKTDMVTGEEVEGATLIVQNEAGDEIARWVSGKEAHSIEALEDGTYTLIEITAPTGYVKNESRVTFQVEAGKTTPVEMENEPYGKAQVLKIDLETRKLIAGATLAIQDAFGNEISRFISGEEPYVISLPKGTYRLVELQAPEGYVERNHSVEFEVKAGKLVQLVVENVKQIEVPNTQKSASFYFYLIGTIILVLGAGTIYMALHRSKSIS